MLRNFSYLFASQMLTTAIAACDSILPRASPRARALRHAQLRLRLGTTFIAFTYLGLDMVLGRGVGREPGAAPGLVGSTFVLRWLAAAMVAGLSAVTAFAVEPKAEVRTLLYVLSVALLGRAIWLWCGSVFAAFEDTRHQFRIDLGFRPLEFAAAIMVLLVVAPQSILAVAVAHTAVWWLQAAVGVGTILKRVTLVEIVAGSCQSATSPPHRGASRCALHAGGHLVPAGADRAVPLPGGHRRGLGAFRTGDPDRRLSGDSPVSDRQRCAAGARPLRREGGRQDPPSRARDPDRGARGRLPPGCVGPLAGADDDGPDFWRALSRRPPGILAGGWFGSWPPMGVAIGLQQIVFSHRCDPWITSLSSVLGIGTMAALDGPLTDAFSYHGALLATGIGAAIWAAGPAIALVRTGILSLRSVGAIATGARY